MRIDSAGAAFDLCQAAQDANIGFLVGFDLFAGVREAILSLPEDAWRPAVRQDGEPREGAQVAEITHVERLDHDPVAGPIAGDRSPRATASRRATVSSPTSKATASKRRSPTCTGDIVEIERLHRGRASAEDRIRAAKQTGLENLPFREFALNAVWLEVSLIAQDLIAWTQRLCLDGELAVCEPKTLRYRLLHTAGRLAFHARRAVLRLQANWPWAQQLATAFARLRALPAPAG